MRILLDECVHAGVKKAFPGHSVQTVPEAGWKSIKNGRLLSLVAGKFDVFLTIDQNLRHQQNLAGLPFAILIVAVPDNRLESYLPLFAQLRAAIDNLKPGSVVVIS